MGQVMAQQKEGMRESGREDKCAASSELRDALLKLALQRRPSESEVSNSFFNSNLFLCFPLNQDAPLFRFEN